MRRFTQLAGAAALLAACNGIVGIEDIYDGERPGAGGTGTDAEAGEGGTSAAGKSGSGGTGAAPEGGTTAVPEGGAGAGAGPAPLGGENTGGSPEPAGTTVRGHVIDFWGHKLPNIPVRIGDAVTSTDDEGAFEIENVPATYDVSFVTEFEFNTVPRTWAWYYHGLTRRDPTLQANEALGPTFGDLELTPQNATVGTDQTISVAVGSKDGNTDISGVTAATDEHTVVWEGPATSSATAHGLQWQRDATTKLPTDYIAYDFTPVTLTETATPKISLDFGPEAIVTGALQGTVTPVTGDDRYNEVFLHFTSGATLRLLSETPAPDEFSYLVPTIPSSTLTVLATEGSYEFDQFALARASGLAPNAKPELTLPRPVQLTSPGADTEDVPPKTTFTFQNTGNPGPYVAQIENVDAEGSFQTLFIVTAEKQFTIPEKMAGGFKLQADKYFEWRVATHGKLGSVDAMAGPDGFLQPFDLGNETPHGPRQADGEYSISKGRFFSTP